MWALGVVLYTMLYGQFPFYDNVPQELFNKIKVTFIKATICQHFFNKRMFCSYNVYMVNNDNREAERI